MNKYKINITEPFYEELDRIYYYICFFLNSPKAAKRLFNKIKEEILTLEYFPERYSRICENEKIKKQNYRKLPINNYIIIYQVDNKFHNVFILHIFHGSQNYFSKL